IEEIFCRIRHSRQLAWDVARISGGLAAQGVHSLNERHPRENTWSLVKDGFEQQPRDGVWVGGAAFKNHADHFAATVGLPSGTRVVCADSTVTPAATNNPRLWCHKDPTRAVPAVDLDPLSIHMEDDLVALPHPQVLAIDQIRRPAIIALDLRCTSDE